MEAKDYWQLFMETGVPEYYMMYSKAMKTEGTHVPYHTGFGAANHGCE